MACPSCRADNPPNTRFCRGCGQVLTSGSAPQMFAQAPPASPSQAQPWGCPACGRQNAPHYEFCLGCGAARATAGALMPHGYGEGGQRALTRGRTPMWIVFVVVAIVAGAVIAGVAMVAAR